MPVNALGERTFTAVDEWGRRVFANVDEFGVRVLNAGGDTVAVLGSQHGHTSGQVVVSTTGAITVLSSQHGHTSAPVTLNRAAALGAPLTAEVDRKRRTVTL